MIGFLKKIHIYIFLCIFSFVFLLSNASAINADNEDYEDYETFDGLSKNNFAIIAGIGINSSLKNVVNDIGMDIGAGIRWSYKVSEQASVLSMHGARFFLNTSSVSESKDISSRSFFMVFYETKVGVSVSRFSPYIKALLGGFFSKNTLIINNELSSVETDKRSELSLAGGFGFGLSFHAAKYLSIYLEYNFILSNVGTTLASSNKQFFKHKMHIMSMGINFEFNIDS